MIYELPEFLSLAECEAARKLFPPPHTATVNTSSAKVEQRALRSGRVSRLLPKTSEERAFIERVHAVILRANAKLYHFEIAGTEALQLAEYSMGNGYGWHLDIGPGGAAKRKLSATIQITSPSEYEGGDLEIWGGLATSRDQGSITIFPAYLLHRVTPVTRGIRHSIVAWSLGETAFR